MKIRQQRKEGVDARSGLPGHLSAFTKRPLGSRRRERRAAKRRARAARRANR